MTRSGLNLEVLPDPNGGRRPVRPRHATPSLWLRPLPTSLDRDSLARWRADHADGAAERYTAALGVVRAVLAAGDADRATVAAEAFAQASAVLAKATPSKRRRAWSPTT